MSLESQDSRDESHQSLRFFTRKLQRHPIFRAWKRPLSAAKSSLPSVWRLATQRFRVLPSAVIVGAQKAGTTQLYAYLIKHPRCFSAAEKEVDYFSKHPERTLEWYRSRFPLRYRVAARQGHALEASPSYMAMPRALRRMQAVLPEARIIVVLRDPVSRTFSHYQHRKTRRLENRSFADVIDDELRQTDFPPQRGVALGPHAKPMMKCLGRSYYALHIELLFELYPRDRVLILDSADLFADTNATCQRVFEFLGVESHDVQPEKVYNRGYYEERIDPPVAERLRQHYRPYDELLAELVGRRFSWMTDAARASAA